MALKTLKDKHCKLGLVLRRAFQILCLITALVVMPAHLLGGGVAYLLSRSSMKRWILAICGIGVRIFLIATNDNSWGDLNELNVLVQLFIGLFNFILSIYLVSSLYWFLRNIP